MLNSHNDALRWNVDGFSGELFRRSEASERESLMIYTADPGKGLLEAAEDPGIPPSGRPARWRDGMPEDQFGTGGASTTTSSCEGPVT